VANLLADPNLWADGDGSPPATWNGSAFAVSVGVETTGFFGISYIGDAPVSGDVVSGTAQQTNEGDGINPPGTIYLNLVDTASDVVLESIALPLSTPVDFSFSAVSEVGALRISSAADNPNAIGWYGLELTIAPEETPVVECNFNCACDDEYPTRTLAQMREFLMIRLGWAAMKDTPLPGVNDTLNAFLQDAQDQLHAEYRIPRMERFFTWDMTVGTKFYDLPENRDECTKKLDPRQVTWVGISDGCDAWRKLVCGIKPEYYYGDVTGMPSHYEIRQCIEVWPPPADDNWKLRVKGYFYSQSLTEDTDVASMDFNAVQLFALANAKAHYGQADAANVMRQAMRYVANMVAGGHHTRRYVPGADEWVAPPLPVLTGYPGDP
jgi:hypothetical protein